MTKTRTEKERKILASVTQGTAAAVLGMKSAGSLRSLRDAPRRKDGSYDLAQLVPWYVSKRIEETADDPLLAGGSDSDEELRRYRLAKARLAEVELGRQLGELASRSYWREFCGTSLACLRRFADKISRYPELRSEYCEVLDEAGRQLARTFGITEPGARSELHIFLPGVATPVILPLGNSKHGEQDNLNPT